MCGFFGIIYKNNNKNIGNILINAGKRLSYRGYDSTGIAVFKKSGTYKIKKDKGKVEEVANKMHFDKCAGYKGILQLRWATYGKPSKINSQPHSDCTKKYISAHNGNIINVHSLFRKLKKKNHKILSENDGEVIVHILEDYLEKGKNIYKSVQMAYKDIEGDYAYVFTENRKDKMIAVKKGSSLFAGIGDDFICVSSDFYSILDHTDMVLWLNDGEMLEFDNKNYKIINIKTGKEIKRKPKRNKLSPESIVKEPYKSFMEKEIHEIPTKISSLREYYSNSRALDDLKKIIKNKKLIITGSGTSYNAALLGTYFLNRIARMTVNTFLPPDISDRLKYTHNGKSNLLVVSQSGETKDIKNAIDSFKTYSNGNIIAMINNVGSTIGMISDYVLPTISDMEISVPATKTFINQATLFYTMALFLSGMKKKDIDKKIKSLEKTIKKLNKKIDKNLDEVVKILYKRDFFHVLGYGITYPVAMEGALKMKEINYINVEAMHSSEFKHGPLALITPHYPVIIISTKRDKHFTLSHINEIKTRDGYIIAISQKDSDIAKNSDLNIVINEEDENLFAISAVYLLQYLSLKIAYKLKIDPDHPRNISKTITVD